MDPTFQLVHLRLSQCGLYTSSTTTQITLCSNSLRRRASSHAAHVAWWLNISGLGYRRLSSLLVPVLRLVFFVCHHVLVYCGSHQIHGNPPFSPKYPQRGVEYIMNVQTKSSSLAALHNQLHSLIQRYLQMRT